MARPTTRSDRCEGSTLKKTKASTTIEENKRICDEARDALY